MTISIIIAVKTWQKNLEECVSRCLELDFPDFEVIILPDYSLQMNLDARIRLIPTGEVTPPKKRDIGIREAKGDIVAFLDDDAYPTKDWLKHAAENFKDESVAAVGGPAVTPDSDSLMQKASGLVYSSGLVSGGFVYRYIPGKRREVQDYPSCNLIVRKAVLKTLGGFNTNFWPGEDTKLCLDITKGMGKKIIYDPEVLVFHHRRSLIFPHLKQIANYALHRGYFVKRYPQTSFKLSYFLPSLFVLSAFAGVILSLFFAPLKITYLAGVLLYLFLVFSASISKGLGLFPLVFSGIILTHITYGLYFLRGLALKKLKEEL
ncbi:MAG: glycosyltransferase [Candidatus Omnitrophota bacterium]